MPQPWVDGATDAFAREWWDDKHRTFFANRFAGVPCLQHPFDAWITEEIIWDTRPEVIVECGSFLGGSALRWVNHQQIAGLAGCVIAIDLHDNMDLARKHPLWEYVTFLEGSTTEPLILARVIDAIDGRRTMVILDSDHKQGHVATEIDLYAPLVSEGCYLIVQDGFVSSIDPDHGPGPLEAIEAFVAADDRFDVDRDRERMRFTFNPSGFLSRRQTAS